jgi:hypothetical protein
MAIAAALRRTVTSMTQTHSQPSGEPPAKIGRRVEIVNPRRTEGHCLRCRPDLASLLMRVMDVVEAAGVIPISASP